MKHYEDLTGKTGDDILYVGERYEAARIFTKPLPEIEVDGKPAKLDTIAMSGIGVFMPSFDMWENAAEDLVSVSIKFSEADSVSFSGKVCMVEPNGSRAALWIEAAGICLNIDGLIARHQQARLLAAIAAPEFGGETSIDPEYRILATEMLYLVRSYKTLLEGVEKNLKGKGEVGRNALEKMRQACSDRFIPQWRELWYRAHDITRPHIHDAAWMAAHKRFSEQVLTPDFNVAPNIRRAYEKPYGYPGDHLIMNAVYRFQRFGELRGDTAFERMMEHLAVDGGGCVGTRLFRAQEILASFVDERAETSTPVRLANLGCGSAYEIYDWLARKEVAADVHFTIIDQDEKALKIAHESILPEARRQPGNIELTALNASFIQLMKAGELFGRLPPQDAVYSLGLYDYLSQKRAKALTAALYEHVAPGGLLMLANVRDFRETCMWPLEFIMDWSLIYRSEDEMHDLVEGLPSTDTRLEIDKTGNVFIITLRKP